MSDKFTQAYIECALWSSSEGEQGEIRLDEHDGDISPETLAQMEQDCTDFQDDQAFVLAQWYALGETEERAGRDFWFTRCGHGVGFWDRYYAGAGVSLGEKLSQAAKTYGNVNLYIGDEMIRVFVRFARGGFSFTEPTIAEAKAYLATWRKAEIAGSPSFMRAEFYEAEAFNADPLNVKPFAIIETEGETR
jgi:hypothetical protein